MSQQVRRYFIEEKIMENAKSTFGEEVTKDNFESWKAHWLATAIKMKNEFKEEGLLSSAQYVQDFIDVSMKSTNTILEHSNLSQP
jgi:hypothetical protein